MWTTATRLRRRPPEDDVPEPSVLGLLAAATANEWRALDVRMPSNKPDLPKEPGGSARLMDGEDFSPPNLKESNSHVLIHRLDNVQQ